MTELRVRIKFAEHEFEAEGPAEAVERRAEAFQLMVAPPPPPPPVPAVLVEAVDPRPLELPEASITVEPPEPEEKSVVTPQEAAPPPLRLDRIMHSRGPVLSLSAATRLPDSILVILLGQRIFRNNEAVRGIEIMEGLRDSGFRVTRVDTLLSRLASEGIIIVRGKHRRRRYRLSVAGIAQAEQIARALTVELSENA
jgi:hypothetical protein